MLTFVVHVNDSFQNATRSILNLHGIKEKFFKKKKEFQEVCKILQAVVCVCALNGLTHRALFSNAQSRDMVN